MTAPTPVLAHTHQMDPAVLTEIRAFLDTAFEGDFSDEDWEHTLGGVHAYVTGDAGILAHGSVVQRRVRYAGRSYRTGYVEGVAVRAGRRREGLGGQVMAALEGVLDGAYDLGALSASASGAPLYRARGWWAWPGRIAAQGPDGTVPLPHEEGSAYLRGTGGGPLPFPAGSAETGTLQFDWRDGDVL
ncbi:GNAT family N-acetyltransferase [Streptomyces halstedii]|uniref:GNAT family N-acetyltransferase n=1 Tax=Streptomyces halstedii TaxID=1944 RepID=A0ABS6TSC1_STRHA|nr:GNAT family N-acetyltransferase [Streptomyces halstedii]MBV7671167.1 GNAT family N-acetyltransferase [Streptomyces halstedii]